MKCKGIKPDQTACRALPVIGKKPYDYMAMEMCIGLRIPSALWTGSGRSLLLGRVA